MKEFVSLCGPPKYHLLNGWLLINIWMPVTIDLHLSNFCQNCCNLMIVIWHVGVSSLAESPKTVDWQVEGKLTCRHSQSERHLIMFEVIWVDLISKFDIAYSWHRFHNELWKNIILMKWQWVVVKRPGEISFNNTCGNETSLINRALDTNENE